MEPLSLSNIAKLTWENRAELRFGSSDQWDEDTFLKSWVNTSRPGLWKNAEGLYWFSSSITVSDLRNCPCPSSLPSSGCDFGDQARRNSDLLKGNLCSDHGVPILYNGQRSKVFSRLRAHFNTSEDTGALGIKEFPLSIFEWSAFVFHVGMVDSIQGLTETQRKYLSALLQDETGRHSIESAWRSIYGWPILCKK